MRAREIPIDPRKFVIRESHRAMTPLEALMQCPPGIEPQESVTAGGELRTLIDEALQGLDRHEEGIKRGRMRFIVEACVIERRSLREVGQAMGLSKTHVARIRDQALGLLRHELVDNTHVRRHLNGQ